MFLSKRKNLIFKNLCFFIVSEKRENLTAIFKINSVLHISCLQNLVDIQYLGNYYNSYICIFKPRKFMKYYKLLNDKMLKIDQICLNGKFLNFYFNLYEYLNIDYLCKEIFSIILWNFYFCNYIILNIILNLVNVLYFFLEKKCLIL